LPIITATKDTNLCDGASVQLNASGALLYNWSPPLALSCINCQSPITNPVNDITYSVSGTDVNGCTDSTSVAIHIIKKLPTSVGPDASYCKGGSANLSAQGGTSYLWLPPTGLDNNQIADPSASPDTSTAYKAIIQQGTCFIDTYNVHVTVYPEPTVQVPNGQTIISGTSLTLQAIVQNGLTYEWSPATDLSCSNCLSPVATPLKSTAYTILVTGSGGCTAKATITIDVKCEADQIFLPNTFTPNGDGLNDRFYPSGKGISAIKIFRVYDRWGELIYDGGNIPLNNPDYGWDGTYMGKQLKPDVYVYFLSAVCESGEPIELKGDVSIIR